MPGMLDESLTPRKSIFDRVLGRLFPARGEQYDELGEQDVGDAQRQALQRVGASLMEQSGPHPQGTTSPLAQLGTALKAGNWPGGLDEAAAHASAFRKMAQEGADRRAIQAIAAKYPAKPGETTPQAMDRFEAMVPDLISAGLYDRAEKLQELVTKSRPKGDAFTTVAPGSTLVQTNASGGPTPVYTAPERTTVPPDRVFENETKLRGDFTQQAAEYANVANGYRDLKTFSSEPRRTATSDQGLVFSYMKMLDPKSTLLNGQRAPEGGKESLVPKPVRELYNLLLDHKEQLSKEQYHDILRLADALLASRAAEFYRIHGEYGRRAVASGGNPANVTYDYFAGIRGIARPGPVSADADSLLNGPKE